MNRAERRLMKKSGVQKSVVEHTLFLEGVKHATSILIPSVAIILHDKFGFGAGRVNRVLEALQLYSDAIGDKEVSSSDLKKIVREEIGIDMK